MKIRIIALGHRMPEWISTGFEHYARRLPREFAIELIEIKPEPRDRGRSVAQMLAAEAKRVTAATRRRYTVALDERGERWTTARRRRGATQGRTAGRVCQAHRSHQGCGGLAPDGPARARAQAGARRRH